MKCRICGKEFTPSKESRTLCSDECRREAKRMNANEYRVRRIAQNRKRLGTRFCTVCGKEFVPKTSQQVRCSPECTRMRATEYKRENVRNNKQRIAEAQKTKKSKEKELLEFNYQAMKAKRTYGKHELKFYLEKQSEEMARRRRELEAEWERKRKVANGRSALDEGVK